MSAPSGAAGLTERVVPFRAGDGFSCNLVNLRGERAPTKGAVILVHGAGVRANLFRAPVRTTSSRRAATRWSTAFRSCCR